MSVRESSEGFGGLFAPGSDEAKQTMTGTGRYEDAQMVIVMRRAGIEVLQVGDFRTTTPMFLAAIGRLITSLTEKWEEGE